MRQKRLRPFYVIEQVSSHWTCLVIILSVRVLQDLHVHQVLSIELVPILFHKIYFLVNEVQVLLNLDNLFNCSIPLRAHKELGLDIPGINVRNQSHTIFLELTLNE